MPGQRRCSPIIVCGSARSGTTFVCDLLDSHLEIAMSDEFFLYKTPSLISFFEEMDREGALLLTPEAKKPRKEQIMEMLWFYTGREERLKKSRSARRFGNKTPGAEHYIDFYDSVFEAHPPLYVHVLRKGEDVFLSVRNTEWGKNAHINGLVTRYIDSIKAIESFGSVNPDRCFMLQLDRIPKDKEGRQNSVARLMEFIGEEVVESMGPFLREWKSVHSTKDLRRNDKALILRSLPKSDIEFLENHEEYQSYLKKYKYK